VLQCSVPLLNGSHPTRQHGKTERCTHLPQKGTIFECRHMLCANRAAVSMLCHVCVASDATDFWNDATCCAPCRRL
jgi:hypothetical protein